MLTQVDNDQENPNETKYLVMTDMQSKISRFYNTCNFFYSIDPFEFYYKHHRKIYSYLFISNLSQMLFSIPASSVPSECLFFQKLLISNIEIIRPDKVEALVFKKTK